MDATPEPTTAAPLLGRYEIDPTRSAVTFRTRHLFGLAPVHGTFAIRSGTVDVAEPLADSDIRVEIATSSFHTGNRQRDDVVRSSRFLDADRHPAITFVGGRVDASTLRGTLTVGGVARPVSLAIEHSSVSPRAFTVRATTRIDRTDFGVTASRGLAGRRLDVTVEATCVRG